jgi:hypothetical protein
MIDHKQGFAADRESQWSWKKPASAGFFSSVENQLQHRPVGASGAAIRLAREEAITFNIDVG